MGNKTSVPSQQITPTSTAPVNHDAKEFQSEKPVAPSAMSGGQPADTPADDDDFEKITKATATEAQRAVNAELDELETTFHDNDFTGIGKDTSAPTLKTEELLPAKKAVTKAAALAEAKRDSATADNLSLSISALPGAGGLLLFAQALKPSPSADGQGLLNGQSKKGGYGATSHTQTHHHSSALPPSKKAGRR